MPREKDDGGNRILRWRSACAVLFVAVALVAPSTAIARSEEQIKAAFLLNFARYVDWPEAAFSGSDAPIQICTVDDAAFDAVIAKTIADKIAGGRRLATRVIALDELKAGVACHILYVGSSDSAAARTTTKVFSEAATFSVANDRGFAQSGGVANFFRAGNKIRFDINPKAASKAGLKISSRLLRLARIVE